MHSRFFLSLVIGIAISAVTPTEIFAQGPHSRGPVRRAGKYLGLGWGSGNHWQNPPVNPGYYNPYSHHNTHLVSRSQEFRTQFGDGSLTELGSGYPMQNPGYGSDFNFPPVDNILAPQPTPAEPLPFDTLPGEAITPEVEELPPPSSVIEDSSTRYQPRNGASTTQATLEWWER